MPPSIVVIGSSNTDMVIKAEHLPAPGETILGGKFFMNPGGKGANQAVAAARLGGNVTFIAKTGNDIFGKQSVQLLEEEGINTSLMIADPLNPSGVAMITVDKNGENCIVVASGSNAELTPINLYNAKEKIEEAFIVLMQLEIPVATVEHVIAVAAAANVKVVLNPAPVCALSDELLQHVSVITPNETEAQMLTGIVITDDNSAEEAARILHKKGIQTVIITLGPRGAMVLHNDDCVVIEAPKVAAVDTTAAGDVFNGALVVSLTEGNDILTATAFACKAAAISVTRMGAQASAPYKKEVFNMKSNEVVV